MNRFFKRALAMLLAAALLIPGLISVLPSAYSNEIGTELPTIYVQGMGCTLVKPDPEAPRGRRIIYPIEVNQDEILALVKENVHVFTKAVATQQWDEFCALLCNITAQYFAEVKFGPDGEAMDDSYPDFRWTRAGLASNNKTADGKYRLNKFEFQYDFRRSPLETADLLRTMVGDVKAVTGAEKVNLIGRCMGSNIVAAYLKKYGYADIAKVLYVCPTLLGAAQCTKAFCGELYLDPDGIERYVYDQDLSQLSTMTGVEDLDQLLLAFLTAFNDVGGLDLAAWSINNVYPKIYLKIVPEILRNSFATWPGLWSMVSLGDFEKAKQTIFYGCNPDEYAGLIEKINAYHDQVQIPLMEDILQMQADGVEVDVIAKYGKQTIPVTRGANKLSDSLLFLEDASLGATAGTVNRPLSIFYLNQSFKTDTAKFLSPDYQVDASTCLLPHNTWFIKNMLHSEFDDSVHSMMAEILNTEQMNVWTSLSYPQYLVHDKEMQTLVPMTEQNADTTAHWRVSFLEATLNVFRYVFRILLRKIQEKYAAPPVEEPVAAAEF